MSLTVQKIKSEIDSKPTAVLPTQELLNMLQSAKIDLTKQVPPPPTAFYLRGKTISTQGNFMAVIGKAKSRKTFLVSLLAAAALAKGKEVQNFASLLRGKVLYFDTEQSHYHVSRVKDRILQLSETEAESCQDFEIYSLRSFNPTQRLQIIETVINQSTQEIGLIVIDGVRDLSYSINDEIESTNIVTRLMTWSEKENCQIITVLHTNKADNNARGHLGTEIINKAEITISVNKVENGSEIRSEFARGEDFDPILLNVDEKGMPYIYDVEQTQKTVKASKEPGSYNSMKHDLILLRLTEVDLLSYQNLVAGISAKVSEVLDLQIGTNKAKEWVSFYTSNGKIKLAEKGKKGYEKTS